MDTVRSGFLQIRQQLTHDRISERASVPLVALVERRIDARIKAGRTPFEAWHDTGNDFMAKAVAYCLDPANGVPEASPLAVRMRLRNAEIRVRTRPSERALDAALARLPRRPGWAGSSLCPPATAAPSARARLPVVRCSLDELRAAVRTGVEAGRADRRASREGWWLPPNRKD